jgi:hypothetical protein
VGITRVQRIELRQLELVETNKDVQFDCHNELHESASFPASSFGIVVYHAVVIEQYPDPHHALPISLM